LFIGNSRIGDAWAARTTGEDPKEYLRVRFDGPDFLEPFGAALFPSDKGDEALQIWRRHRAD
jgi:uncharacterized protein (DUF736 family)